MVRVRLSHYSDTGPGRGAGVLLYGNAPSRGLNQVPLSYTWIINSASLFYPNTCCNERGKIKEAFGDN